MEVEIIKMFECDVLVVGGGGAGYGAAVGAASSLAVPRRCAFSSNRTTFSRSICAGSTNRST